MPLRIWIASFIPSNIANYTKPVPQHAGKTVIPGPWAGSDCFWTDQRSFSDSYIAPSRMRSLVEIDTVTLALQSQSHHCDNTIECDCEDGAEECNKTPDSSALRVDDFSVAGSKCTFTLNGVAGNPCFLVAPKIEWAVNVVIEKSGNAFTVKLGPNSLVEPFPAFEMYTSLNGSAARALFTRAPDAGTTPADLVRPPNKPVVGSVTLP